MFMLRRSGLVLLLASSLIFGCQKNKPEAKVEQVPQPGAAATVAPRPEEPPVLEQAKLGSNLGRRRNVEEEKTTFRQDEPIYLTMWLRESPPGLQAGVRWFDDTGIVVSEETRPMFGMKTATFHLAIKKPRPGNYRAVGFSGDKVAVEYNFTITE